MVRARRPQNLSRPSGCHLGTPAGTGSACIDTSQRVSTSLVSDGRRLATLVLLLAASLLIGNATTALWDQDEAAYAGFARRMLLGEGSWVVPEYPYSQPHRKPPMAFWLMAGSYAALGINEFAARLPSTLSVAGSAACLWFFGGFLVGRRTARLAAIVLASSLFVLNMGKIALTDGVLLACQTVAALALLRGAVRPSWGAFVVLWSAVAVGVLVKGPPILILVGGMFLFLLVFHRRRRNLVHLHPWLGLPLALLPTIIWLSLAWQEDQRYVLFLGYWYIARRVGGSVFGQVGLPGTHLLIMFVALLPWTAYLPAALRDVARGLWKRRLAAVLLASWLFGGWVLWEIPASKLPTYALGAYPALALLIARVITQYTRRPPTWERDRLLRFGFSAQIVAAVLAAAALTAMGFWVAEPWAKLLGVAPAAVLLIVVVAALRIARRRSQDDVAFLLASGGLIAHLLFWATIVPGMDSLRGAPRALAHLVASRSPSGTTVVVGRRMLSPSLPFYVEQAGLRFDDVLAEREPRPRVVADWSLLWRGQIRELVRQVEAQNPPRLPRAEEDALRLARVRAALGRPAPTALVLDQVQHESLAAELAGRTVVAVRAWLIDKLEFTTYVVVLPAGPRVRIGGPKRDSVPETASFIGR